LRQNKGENLVLLMHDIQCLVLSRCLIVRLVQYGVTASLEQQKLVIRAPFSVKSMT
jgi:hypothetical protein